MENEKPKFNWLNLIVTALVVLISASVVGGTTYYVLNTNFQKERDASEKAFNNALLNNKIAETNKEEKSVAKTNTSTPTTKNTTYTDSTGKYTITIPEGYVVTMTGSCEGGCGSKITLNKKINDVSYATLLFTISSQVSFNSKNLSEFNTAMNFPGDNSTIKGSGTTTIGGQVFTKYVGGGFFGEDDHYRIFRNHIGYDINVIEGVDKSLSDSVISSFKFN